MKTAVILFRSPESELDGEYLQTVISVLTSGGITVDNLAILDTKDESSLRRRIEEFKDVADNLVIIDSEEHGYDLREMIASKMETVLVENENAKVFLDAVSKADGINYSEQYALLPVEATVIPNVRGAYQGFILDANEFSLAVLPSEIKELKIMCDKYLLPYFENKYDVKSKRLVLKYFGDKKSLMQTVEQVIKNVQQIKVNCYGKNGDITVDLLFNGVTDAERMQVVRELVKEHKDNIYAEFDTTLGERLFDVLKLKNLKLSVAESFTGGRVASAVIANSGASAFVHEGIISYTDQSKIERLGVSKSDLEKNGAVSSIVAYQMAAGLLKSGNCDVAIATTGIAGPNSDNSNQPVGLCYIAVGMKDGVHTYRYNLSGNREEITETAKNTALFLAIKKLKSI